VKKPRTSGFVPMSKADRALVQAAGGPIWPYRGGLSRSERSGAFCTSPLTMGAVEVAKAIALRTKKTPAEILRALCASGQIKAAGTLWTTVGLSPWRVNVELAKVFGVPVVLGPVRANPDGSFDLTHREGVWVPATDATLAALASEMRLGGKPTMAHWAAEALLDWKRGDDAK